MSVSIPPQSTYYASLMRRRLSSDLDRQLSAAGREVSTGIKDDIYRALGARSGEALEVRARMERNANFINSNKLLSNRLELTATALKEIRETAQEFQKIAVPNAKTPTQTVRELQAAARSALEQITYQINVTYGDAALFGGTDSAKQPLQQFEQVNGATGLSPKDVLDQVIAGGLANAGDAAAKIAELQGIFDNVDPTPARNYESTFYNGTDTFDAFGQRNTRLTAQIDDGVTLEHGVQASEPAFADLVRGLSMLAATDPAQIADGGAYAEWVGNAVSAIGAGVSGILDTETRLGGQQQVLERTLNSQEGRDDLYNSQVLTLEGVDAYEAAAKVRQLQTQLEATYAVSSRLANLSFLNYM
jgi:flagellar hook-associated protein 3 FlgL